MYHITKEFKFDAAHSLPHLPATHKCHNLHGHTYTVRVHCCSKELDPDKHWVVDYTDIKQVVQPVIDKLDHRNLNDVVSMPTTAENLSKWLYDTLKPALPSLTQLDVSETAGTCCNYTPDL